MELHRDGDVLTLTLAEPDQQLNGASLAAWNAHLDEAAATEGPAALVVAAEGKTFHQGLDLDHIGGLGEGLADFIRAVHGLFGRLLCLEMPTVAAITGHAIAAGAMLASCLDVRIMRADRGWFRTPEVELGMPFTVVMNDLLSARFPQPARHRLMVLGERMGGGEAAAAGVVDEAVDGADAVIAAARDRAADLARYRGPNIRIIREGLYHDLLAQIGTDPARADLTVR